MGAPDVAQQGFINFPGLAADDQFGLNSSFAMPERGCDLQEVIDDPGLIEAQYAGKVFGGDGNPDFAGRYVDAISERQMKIVNIIRCTRVRLPQ